MLALAHARAVLRSPPCIATDIHRFLRELKPMFGHAMHRRLSWQKASRETPSSSLFTLSSTLSGAMHTMGLLFFFAVTTK